MHYHFVGIKGSGMASLATIVADRGYKVSGSDIEKYIFTQKALEERNIPIYSFDEHNIQKGMTVIVGNAFQDSHVEVKKALALQESQDVVVYRYHEFLGNLIQEYCSISVAGTHGKTTTTGLLAHVMSKSASTGFLIGDGSGDMPQDAKYFVVESCEYKRHFLAYRPDYAIITNIELDHVDYYHSMEDYCNAFESFANQVKKGIVLFGDDEHIRSLRVDVDHLYYGLEDTNDVQAVNIKQMHDGMKFDVLYKKEKFGTFKLPFVGKPLLWNSLGVIAVGIMEGLPYSLLQDGLASFQGVKRRFSVEQKADNVFIDDYAHHPTAIQLMIEAVRTKYPNKKIVAIFKPDRFSRIAYFIDRFQEAFQDADYTYLCDFPENAVIENGVHVTIDDLAKVCGNAMILPENESGAKQLAKHASAVYVFMSSKDIYKLKNILMEILE